MASSVKVAVRVRPFNKREIDLDSGLIVSVSGNQVVLDPSSVHNGQQHRFTFDYSYWSHSREDAHFADNDRVFLDLGTDVVENAFTGYNACVFAYGQTGSGKTFTMMGTEENRGLIPRICQTLFRKMQESGKEEEEGGTRGGDGGAGQTTFRTEVSYLEIYNEKVKDLLRKGGSTHNMRVREHPLLGPYVENLSRHLVMDYSEILSLMEKGNAIRTTASTNMNDTSSRSHAIFTITFVKAGFLQGVPHETVSKIHLVDLAGSERADATGATGQRLKEGAHINKSLVTLGSVISALSEMPKAMVSSTSSNSSSGKSVFIPYRDSVLTWLLKDSLGGNSKTIMIATISPAEVNHSETLSTLRYANRAKNIVNKPTVNEDPNVRLIRELRDEIDRLRSAMSTDPDTRKQLAVKEAQERHLTEEWAGKWKETANILKEQRALALKRTAGLGIILDSDQPHLVGVDEDVLSTGITLYHLKDGDTIIGSEAGQCDIVLKGPGVEKRHCKISLCDVGGVYGGGGRVGVATLVPEPGALCLVNAALVSEPTKLSQGCVLVLGRTNMFRYNDPKEAEDMRQQNKEEELTSSNRSLLSSSLSDLRNAPSSSARLHASEGNITEFNNNWKIAGVGGGSSNGGDDLVTSTAGLPQTSSSQSSSEEEMNELYRCICEQKNVIIQCLESEQCDIATLNKQISILQGMQENYSKIEYELARDLWTSSRQNGAHDEDEDDDDNTRSFDDHFSAMVEQEVDRRIFQEKVLRAESEFHERELIRMQKEREVEEIRRQHDKEVYLLKKRLHEAEQQQLRARPMDGSIVANIALSVQIPTYRFSGLGRFVEFEVIISAQDATWTVTRRYRRFRELHVSMCQKYGPLVQSLNFPGRRFYGSTSDSVSQDRQRYLQSYLNQLLLRCSSVPNCPLFLKPLQEAVVDFSEFFSPSKDYSP